MTDENWEGEDILRGIVENCLPDADFKVIEPNVYDNDYTFLIWLSKDLKSGTIGSISDGDWQYEFQKFSIQKRGKTGRYFKSRCYCSKDIFFEGYDNYIAELILLGQSADLP